MARTLQRLVAFLTVMTIQSSIAAFVPTTRQRPAFRARRQFYSSLSETRRREAATTVSLQPIEIVDGMPEWLKSSTNNGLNNTYYLLRHGQSTSNVEGVISSDRALAYSDAHGLTPLGVQQAREAAAPLRDLIQQTIDRDDDTDNEVTVVFVSSPFARAHQTARACRDELVHLLNDGDDNDDIQHWNLSSDIILQDQLVERYFGRLDGQELFTYAYIWPLDKFNVTHTAFEAESVAAVCHRVREVIWEMERRHRGGGGGGAHVVLTSHADVLQITQLYAAEASNVGDFSSFRFTNGEVRRMTVGSTADLPEPSPLPRPVRGTYIP